MKFPLYKQFDAMDCGPTCLRMIAKFYGKDYALDFLRSKCQISRAGVSLLGISEAAESLGLKTLAFKTSFNTLQKENPCPFIVHWGQNHFVVVYKIHKKKVYVADPGRDYIIYSDIEFQNKWATTREKGMDVGIALILEPTASFFSSDDHKKKGVSFAILIQYLKSFRGLLFQVILSFITGTILMLILPFLTQAVVDIGIRQKDIGFIYLILLAQLGLFIGQACTDFIRSWLLLHINVRINLFILSDFLIKLMKLPISFFDSKMVGDVLQRIGDQERIQRFLTGTAFNTIFSFLSFFVFMGIIAVYDYRIFLVYFFGSILYLIWVVIFMKYRKMLDYQRFELAAQNQSKVIQLVEGMQEIKMNNCEVTKRWEWERVQAKLFKTSVKALTLNQYQLAGGVFINQSKNIICVFLAATSVVNGDLTLGSMLAIQYILGQLNLPLELFIQFIQSSQDALISMERINEVHEMEDEHQGTKTIQDLNNNGSIMLKNVVFRYPGVYGRNILDSISMVIPKGRTTAIVGASGSGKTTLLKLLMKFYEPTNGEIEVSNIDLKNINAKIWRKNCGAVLQDNYFFSDSIAKNISISDPEPDMDKLIRAIKIANIYDFIYELPLGLDTVIGTEGIGLSQGQKQRILIARAVYKDPEYIFFDEATNALDANNEKIIMKNLEEFFSGKTVVTVAHRLSTVKNANQIIVLDQGQIVEIGTHEDLVESYGVYFQLVSNQLELGQ